MIATLLLVGCSQSVVVDAEFPEAVIPALPLRIGIHYSDAFRGYQYTEDLPNDVEWYFDLGGVNTKLFDGIFSALFDITSVVENAGGDGAAFFGLDAVISPEIEAFEFSLPRQSRSDQYAVWIRYNLHIHDPTGTLITTWPVSAYGQSDARTFGASAAMEEAIIRAMRDAAASIIIGFAEEQKIREALLDDGDS